MRRRIVDRATGAVLASSAGWARTRGERLRGLIGRPPLESGQALILEPARQVHTFGVGYPIDVLFCDPDWTVLHVVTAMKPRRISLWVRRARFVVELPAGAVPADRVPQALEVSG